MAQQTINIGTVADDGTGDPLRTAFDKANDNFDELYAVLPAEANATADQTGAEIEALLDAELGNTDWKKEVGTSAGTIAAGDHNHSGVYEPADGTILKDADIDVTVQSYDANTMKSDTGANLTAGFTTTSDDQGTKSSGSWQPDATNGQIQEVVNGGAHTLTPPAGSCSMCVKYTNNASAGAITTSGFTITTGDTPTTTDGHKFLFYITNAGGDSHLHIVALQ